VGRPSRVQVYANLDQAFAELRERLGGLPVQSGLTGSGPPSGSRRPTTPQRSRATLSS